MGEKKKNLSRRVLRSQYYNTSQTKPSLFRAPVLFADEISYRARPVNTTCTSPNWDHRAKKKRGRNVQQLLPSFTLLLLLPGGCTTFPTRPESTAPGAGATTFLFFPQSLSSFHRTNDANCEEERASLWEKSNRVSFCLLAGYGLLRILQKIFKKFLVI